MLDKYAIVPISACIFALIATPLIQGLYPSHNLLETTDYVSRIVWPALTAISLMLVMRDPSRLRRLIWPPHILCLFACLALAGASVLWAFKPESSFVRFVQQVMVVTSVILPALLADQRADMMRALFLCFAFASILNVFFVLGGDPQFAVYGSQGRVAIGYPGYFAGKNYLGECATLALLLSLHEVIYPGLRRALGIIVIAIAIFLIVASDSKTALGLAIVTPVLAGLTLIASKNMRLSPAIILLSIPLCYAYCRAYRISV